MPGPLRRGGVAALEVDDLRLEPVVPGVQREARTAQAAARQAGPEAEEARRRIRWLDEPAVLMRLNSAPTK
jgi:hypothetical protein